VEEIQADIVEITSRERDRKPFVSQVSSAVRTMIVGAIVAGSSTIAVAQPYAAASVGSRIQVLRPVNATSPKPYGRTGGSDAADTQYGQSTVKLAKTFTSYFQPAAPEDAVDDDQYCFG
jgi:hypothetical protein